MSTTIKLLVVVSIVISALLVAVRPAHASIECVGNCKYGYVQTLDPKTHYISTRCRTWAEWQAMQVKSAVKSAQSTYERQVTQPIVKKGYELNAPVAKSTHANNAWWLLRQGK